MMTFDPFMHNGSHNMYHYYQKVRTVAISYKAYTNNKKKELSKSDVPFRIIWVYEVSYKSH